MALPNGTLTLIQTVTVTNAGGQAEVEFNPITQNYDDLVIMFSARNTGDFNTLGLKLNGVTTNQTARRVLGNGTTASSSTYAEVQITPSSATAGIFGNGLIYIPNYKSNTSKTFSIDAVSENNAALSYQTIEAWLWNSTSAISSVALYGLYGGSIAQHSSFTLYGVLRAVPGVKANGGEIYQDTDYIYHLFKSSGVFTPTQSVTADVLVVAGGGGGGDYSGGGGGAGGLLQLTSQSLTATNYAVTIGAGGNKGSTSAGTQGSNSQFGALTAAVGGGFGFGANGAKGNGGNGGSGGGAGGVSGSTVGGSPTSGQGFKGGDSSFAYAGAGGGGAGAAAANATGGSTNGGAGLSSTLINTMGAATSTGILSSGSYYFAGGGAGNAEGGAKTGGIGGGGNTGVAGIANTGGGGGGDSANGGSGIVIIRYAK